MSYAPLRGLSVMPEMDARMLVPRHEDRARNTGQVSHLVLSLVEGWVLPSKRSIGRTKRKKSQSAALIVNEAR